MTVLNILLFLALAGTAGWIYWSVSQQPPASDSSPATAVIGTPVPAPPADDTSPAATSPEDTSGDAAAGDTASEPASPTPDSPTEEQPGADPATEQAPAAQPAPVSPEPEPEPAPEPTPNKPADGTTPAPAPEATPKPEAAPAPQQAEDAAPKEPAEKPGTADAVKQGEDAGKTEKTEQSAIPGDIDLSLSPVPHPDLTRPSAHGLLPVIGPSGQLPWRTYARPFADPMERPRIAIVISEMGMSQPATRSTIQNMPGAVTLSFNPYARDLQAWIEEARAAGHEVLLQLPMEPFGYPANDPGPQSLLTSLTDQENINRLEWMLGRFTGYTGVTNQMGSKFTASAEDIQPVLEVLKERGLLFLDGRTSSKSVAGPLAASLNLPVAINNRFLDHKADRATIDARLADLERIARYTGTAIGIGYPYPVTLERLQVWAQTLSRKGFALVPVSAAVNRQEFQ
ncbi:divergent polysaccharide deacetylase family protein [Sneathiella chinensis]|uniref:Divergent polysaccharide deacetylase family protein n=1 Tax=Sneathiella chinensis TaxID=349750 RepID=A0ABQ5U865_9PROT|nr:divergent polysaccharide deacetylase family protein [Sneathiella chinensis]GLQ07873.1 hypothetical protein GCM10007924_30950 [Sneathiella chinensis]